MEPERPPQSTPSGRGRELLRAYAKGLIFVGAGVVVSWWAAWARETDHSKRPTLLLPILGTLALLLGTGIVVWWRRHAHPDVPQEAPPPEASQGTLAPPDRPFTLGLVLLVCCAPGTWMAWITRSATGPPVLAISLAGLALAGLALVAFRVPSMTAQGLSAQLRAEQNPLATLGRLPPRLAAGVFLLTGVAMLVFIAVRREYPPFVPPPGVDGAPPGLNPTWLATILWAFVGLAGAVLFVETVVETRWLTSLWTAALFGLAILVLAGGLAVVYFLALKIPRPSLDLGGGRSILWRLPGWGAILIFGLVRWWMDLAKATGDREAARGRKAPPG